MTKPRKSSTKRPSRTRAMAAIRAPPELQPKAGKMNDPGAAKSEPKEGPADPAKGAGQPRGDEPKENPRNPSFDRIAKNIERLQDKGPEAEAAAQELKDMAKTAD